MRERLRHWTLPDQHVIADSGIAGVTAASARQKQHSANQCARYFLKPALDMMNGKATDIALDNFLIFLFRIKLACEIRPLCSPKLSYSQLSNR